MSWEEAYSKARSLVQQMTAEEKYSRMWGQGWDGPLADWWYIGNIPAVPRLGIPPLNMQDSSAGFRSKWSEMVGTGTCWPSMLAAAASWSPELVRDFGAALGQEFKTKGANVLLGPSVNVHRVARGGRNFELLSGEDPHLGSALAAAYVKGVQSQGVMAVVKHFAFNSQELNRTTESSDVDEQTAWELYYPPFQAAVDAGVVAAMCSYNEIQGVPSCSSAASLNGVLRGRMGFRGFVMSDWGATRNTSIDVGLDASMPLEHTDDHFSPSKLARFVNQSEAHQKLLDEAVAHQLAAMHRLGQFDVPVCQRPPCKDWQLRNTSTAGTRALALRIASESIVLLKNDRHVLPLSDRVKTIAVIGSASVAVTTPDNMTHLGDYYSGGGSGHVQASDDNLWTALAGIRQRLPAGIELLVSITDDLKQAQEAAARADVAVVVAGATSGEGVDRTNLSLERHADALISSVSAVAKRTVVLLQVPGAVLTPWRDSVDSIAVQFLGGEATGLAWGGFLFGNSPRGRLPITFPGSENDEIPPSPRGHVRYAERMESGYRNATMLRRAAFPFGHGLSYGRFQLERASEVACDEAGSRCISATVKNHGPHQASALVQLYLQMPNCGLDSAVLKGWSRTVELAVGEATAVRIALTADAFRCWSADKADWVAQREARAHMGFSSTDLQATLELAPAPIMV